MRLCIFVFLKHFSAETFEYGELVPSTTYNVELLAVRAGITASSRLVFTSNPAAADDTRTHDKTHDYIDVNNNDMTIDDMPFPIDVPSKSFQDVLKRSPSPHDNTDLSPVDIRVMDVENESKQ